MKAVIFSCSLKNSKYSNSRAWSELMAKRLKIKGVQTEVINLKDYDYEASRGKDPLHGKLIHLYDASYIIFAAPTYINHISITCKNLVERFIHAHKKCKKDNLNIFQNKVWELVVMCNPGGVNIRDIEGAPEWWIKNRILTKEQPYPDWKSHHGYMLEKLSFIKHIGIKSSYVGTYSPYRPTGPNVNTMQDHQDTIRICDDIVEGFVACELDNNSITPACELEQFMSYFESDDQHAFGRGLTIAEEDINTDSVQENIEFIEKTVENLNTRGQLIIAMKGRCERVGRPDLAETYYLAQRRLIAGSHDEHPYSGPEVCSGNYRPIGY